MSAQTTATAEVIGAAPVTILGIGGSTRSGSTSECALRICAEAAEAMGANVELITGRDLVLPIYEVESAERAPAAVALIEALKRADGLIVTSPGYHGLLSGLIKNALDYAEDLRHDDRVYLEDVAVGCVATARGWQAAVSTLQSLRSVVHALRGWPTPLGVAVNSSEQVFDEQGRCVVPRITGQLVEIGRQVTSFAMMRKRMAMV